MTTQSSPAEGTVTETRTDEVQHLVIGRIYSGSYEVIGHVTPDLDLPYYLKDVERRLGYSDVHVARCATTYERITLEDAEAERTVYPDHLADQTKVTRKVGGGR